tara:strand:+ start:2319 stop:2912 length:594 start_codon:yes stop_codon:yes gene_type:complete
MGRQYSFLDGELRLFDNTGATPFYYKVKFTQADPQIPAGRPRPEQRLILDRGRASSDMKYAKGPDDPIFEPIDITFTARIDENVNRQSLWQALICGTVGAHNWASTKGTSQLESITLPDFDNDNPMQCVNVEVLYTGATTNWGRRVQEVFFPPEQILFGAADNDGIPFSVTGRVYGPITSMSAFTTPNVESTGGTNA